MRAALIGSVEFNQAYFATEHFDMVVAVDGGWMHCQKAGIVPDVALGDFDSLGFVPEGVRSVVFPSIKDESDMELALDYACDQGADEVVIFGAFAQRIDHTLANLQVMAAGAQRGIKVLGIGSDFAIVALAAQPASFNPVPKTLLFDAFDPGDMQGSYAPYISVFPIGAHAQGVSIAGLQYEVDDFILPANSSRGLSNKFIGRAVRIALTEGTLVIFFPLDALQYATF